MIEFFQYIEINALLFGNYLIIERFLNIYKGIRLMKMYFIYHAYTLKPNVLVFMLYSPYSLASIIKYMLMLKLIKGGKCVKF
jgi:hypothetical protein